MFISNVYASKLTKTRISNHPVYFSTAAISFRFQRTYSVNRVSRLFKTDRLDGRDVFFGPKRFLPAHDDSTAFPPPPPPPPRSHAFPYRVIAKTPSVRGRRGNGFRRRTPITASVRLAVDHRRLTLYIRLSKRDRARVPYDADETKKRYTTPADVLPTRAVHCIPAPVQTAARRSRLAHGVYNIPGAHRH